MSAEHALHNALLAKLRADATLRSLLAEHPYGGSPSVPAVFEYVPQSSTPESASRFPYVVIGDTTAAPFDTDDINGQEHTVTLHIWDRYKGGKRVRQVMDAIYDALHEAELSVDGQNTIFCYFDFSESVPDPDIETRHGVARYRIVTQEG
jgi:hypothetical protein